MIEDHYIDIECVPWFWSQQYRVWHGCPFCLMIEGKKYCIMKGPDKPIEIHPTKGFMESVPPEDCPLPYHTRGLIDDD